MEGDSKGATMGTSGRSWHWASEAEWDRAFEESPTATGFHSRNWCEAIARHSPGYTARALALKLPDGSSAVLPVAIKSSLLRRGLFARGVSNLRNTYGGPLIPGRAPTPEDWASLQAQLDRVPLGRIDSAGSPFDTELGGRPGSRECTSCVIDLPELPEEARSSYRGSCRRAVRKAEKADLRCERLTDESEIAEYEGIYRESAQRWGVEAGALDSIELFQDLARQTGIEFWGVRRPSGELDAGGVFLFSNAHCVYWHGALSMSGSQNRPANLLHDTLIEEARRRGCRLYDFNPNSDDLEGVDTFKQSFNPRIARFHRWRHTHPWLKRIGK